LPGAGEVGEELAAYVTRHIGEPGQRSAQLRQVVALIERAQVDAFVTRLFQTQPPLLKRDVP
jgi:hypothetical protein